MNLQEFTEQAIKTESVIDVVETDARLFKQALWIFIHASSVLDAMKKNIFYGKPIDWNKLAKAFDDIRFISEKMPCALNADMHDRLDVDPRIFHSIVGICTESGELAELLARTIGFPENGFDVVNFGEELGDIDWYKAIGTDATGLNPDNILDTVIKKLQKRYPDKFTSDDAINRNVDAERSLLEEHLDTES